ncbi:c-type cytochrome domain-containing protein [Fodinibius salsisoli]|uniref:Planctomycete cytochrome C n=1 Tax=Fodinibius salsisoli TaxID=2820877 RepID=A0ABT3PQE5_9BACT|nr:c-type cytochrome domain-containing protein [Fodinibius salsisoli]MCW9708083.1 hypothetical protein [Fodinibius salsisoli]
MEQEVSDFVLFLGRFHPLILHLPIGFLVMATILEGVSRLKRFDEYNKAVELVLLLGSLSAVAAALLGYMLAQAGGYGEQLLIIHQWSGVGVAVASAGAYLLKRYNRNRSSALMDRAYLSLLTIMVIALGIAGHYGGSLTHGSDYLTQYMPNGLRTVAGLPPKEEKGFKKITNLEEAAVYNDIIDPIFETRCTSCHNQNKKKGELQMHTRQLLMKGGEGGPIIVEGEADKSEMIKRINLPEAHDDHMPPEGKRPLTSEYKKLLEWWVNSGAPFEKRVSELKRSKEIQSALNTLVDPQANMSPAEKLLASDIDPVESKVQTELQKHGVDLRPVSDRGHWLQADIKKEHSVDSLLVMLKKVSPQLTWLDLGETTTTDKALQPIREFPNLTRLHLQNTRITDKGLSELAGLANLEYLNLYGTAVTDAGIQQLEKLDNLTKLFVWRTQVTQEGAQDLQETLPNLKVYLGAEKKSVALENDSK